MRTQRIIVADHIELAVDTWTPDAGKEPAPDRADRPAFVLVHGLASNARLWDGVAERLRSSGHAVATVDLRGHGRSSKPDGPYDVPTVADDVATVITALGYERPVVAGQSWGGNVVLELAARRPDAVRGIACIDGGWLEPSRVFPDWEACRRALAPPHLAGRRLTDIEGHIRAAHPDWPEAGIRGTLANFEVRADGTVAPWLRFDRHIAVLHGLWDHHPSARYRAVRVPVLLVPVDGRGGERTEDKRRAVALAQADLPNGRSVWFEGDHDIHAQHPDELADVMRETTADGFFR